MLVRSVLAFVFALFAPLAHALEVHHQIDLTSRHYVDVLTQVTGMDTNELHLQTGSLACQGGRPRAHDLLVARPGGQPLSWQIGSDNSLHIRSQPDTGSLEIRYRIRFAQNDTRNHLEADRAVLDLSSWLWHHHSADEQTLSLLLPRDWPVEHMPLPPADNGRWLLNEPDRLARAPIVLGQFLRVPLSGGSQPVTWLLPRNELWQPEQGLEGLRRLTEELAQATDLNHAYTLISLFGGHTPVQAWPELGLLTVPAWGQRDALAYQHWLEQVATVLWTSQMPSVQPASAAGALANYLGPLSIRRAGLLDHQRYLARLESQLGEQAGIFNPAASAACAEPDNVSLALRLDAWLREAASDRHPQPLEDWLAEARDHNTTVDLTPLFSTLPTLDQALATLGLEGRSEPGSPRSWLGGPVRRDARTLHLTRLVSTADNPLRAGDEILALDGYRVTADDWPQRLNAYQPGDAVTVLLARNNAIQQHRLRLSQRPVARKQLTPLPSAAAEQRLNRWLDGGTVAMPEQDDG